MFRTRSVRSFLSCALLLLIALSVVAPCAPVTATQAEPLVAVVGHLELAGPPAVQMLIREHGRGQYLLIEQASKAGFTVVDVTKSEKAIVVKQAEWPNHAANGKLRLVNANLFLSTTPENTPAATPVSSPTQTLNLLDLRDPENPKVIRSFTGVTTMLLDENRELLYLTNAEGLWILKYKQEQPETSSLGCPADGSLTTDPICTM